MRLTGEQGVQIVDFERVRARLRKKRKGKELGRAGPVGESASVTSCRQRSLQSSRCCSFPETCCVFSRPPVARPPRCRRHRECREVKSRKVAAEARPPRLAGASWRLSDVVESSPPPCLPHRPRLNHPRRLLQSRQTSASTGLARPGRLFRPSSRLLLLNHLPGQTRATRSDVGLDASVHRCEVGRRGRIRTTA